MDMSGSDANVDALIAEGRKRSAVVDNYEGKNYLIRRLTDELERAYRALAALDAETEVKVRKQFPILGSGGAMIDCQLVADHGKQAQANHGQSVQRLAERGGLSWCELHAVLHNERWRKMDQNEAMLACRALEARYLAALVPPESRS